MLGLPRDGFIVLMYGYVQPLLAGHLSQVHYLYPFLAMALMALPAVGHVSIDTYGIAFAVMIVAVDAVGLLFARRAERDGRRYTVLAYVLIVALVGPDLLLWRYDLAPALCQLGALVCLLRGRRGWSWLLLGLGIALKLYVAVLIPLWIVWELRAYPEGAVRRVAFGLALAVLPVVAVGSLALPAGTRGLSSIYSSPATRTATVDSTPAVVLAELGRHGWPERAINSQDCFCWVREGRGAGTIRRVALGVEAVMVIVVAGLLWRRPSADALVRASVAIVIIVVLVSPVLSPQFILWPLPALSLMAWRPLGRFAIVLGGAAAGLTWYSIASFPAHFDHIVRFDDIGQLVLLLRIALLLGVVVILALDRKRVTPSHGARLSRLLPRGDPANP